MRRMEELQDWICQVTEQPTDPTEHLSTMLQDGQMLCMLANAIDPAANLKVNKLNTVFHSKANIRLFLEWCRTQGLRDAELFQPDDVLDADSDFVSIIATLSILFDKFGNVGYTGPYEEDDSNPLSDSESQTSSTGSSRGNSPVTKKASNSKLTSFMKGNFFGKKKSAKNKAAKSAQGTPPSTPPPMSPQVQSLMFSPQSPPPRSPDSPPRSPDSPPPQSPLETPPPPRKETRSNSGGANASRLNAFLSQMPPARDAPLEHVQRPAGPPKKSSVPRKMVPPPAVVASPVPPPVATPPKSTPSPVVARSGGSSDVRNKFAAFMRSNPPAIDTVSAPSSTHGAGPASDKSTFVKSVSPSSLAAATPSKPVVEPAAPKSEPVRGRLHSNGQFAQRKAVFSPKSVNKPVSGGFSSSPPTSASTSPTSRPAATSSAGNKLQDFMKKQPPALGSANKARSDSNQSKLAAFISSNNLKPSAPPTAGFSAPSYSKPSSPKASINSFNPSGAAGANTNMFGAPARKPSYAPVTSAPATSASNGSSKFPFTPRRKVERSTGRGNYVRKRQTYWNNRHRRRSTFSLEEKRKHFMNEQLQLKEEQLRRQAAGASNKQNLIVPGVQCYVPDKEEVWLLSEIVDYNERRKEATITAFLDTGGSEQRVVDLKDPETIRAVAGPTATEIESLPIAILHDNPGGVEDMRLLRYLNEPSILFNLKQRFEASKPCKSIVARWDVLLL